MQLDCTIWQVRAHACCAPNFKSLLISCIKLWRVEDLNVAAKLPKSSIKEISAAIVSPKTDDLPDSILTTVAILSELELYLERKKFLEAIQEQCAAEFGNLVNGLCQKYSTLYASCQGKDGYLKFQCCFCRCTEYFRCSSGGL